MVKNEDTQLGFTVSLVRPRVMDGVRVRDMVRVTARSGVDSDL